MNNARIDHATRRQLIDLLERLGGGLAAQGTGWEDSLSPIDTAAINDRLTSAYAWLKGFDDVVLDAMNRHHAANKAPQNDA